MSGQPEGYGALIIGGGLAGASLAIQLARTGAQALLLEKESQPHHKVCGEFLSGEAVSYLHALGINVAAMGGLPISIVRLAANRILAETRLPFLAYSLSRFTLDEALLQQASSSGARVLRGHRVQSLVQDGDGWRVSGNDSIYCSSNVFVATGKHDLRGWQRPEGRQPDLIGFKMHWQVSPSVARDLSEAIEIILFPGGYAGVQLVAPGIANLGLLVHKSQYKQAGGNWSGLLQHMRQGSRHFAARFQNASPSWPTPLAVSSIPYGHLTNINDGLWRLGDQAAVIPSFAGSGMSIALHSASLAARAFSAGASPLIYQRRLRSDLRSRIWLATLLSKALISKRCEPVVETMVHAVPRLLSLAATCTRVPAASLR